MYADSADNLRNPRTICGFGSQFADSTYSCGFHDNLSLLKTYTIICSWIPELVPDSINFVADSEKLSVFGAILSNTVF